MKDIRADLPRNLDKIKILIFADWHIGAPNCNYDIITEQIKQVRENKDTYCVVNGDICDNAIKNSKGDTNSQTLTPDQQKEKAIELLEPIKHKILAMTSRKSLCKNIS